MRIIAPAPAQAQPEVNSGIDFPTMLGIAETRVLSNYEKAFITRMIRRRALLGDAAEYTVEQIERIRTLAMRHSVHA